MCGQHLISIVLHISHLKELRFSQANACYKHLAPNGAKDAYAHNCGTGLFTLR
jgi:hypothetical protein